MMEMTMTNMMSAVTQHIYGPPESVLAVEEVAVPSIATDELLIASEASSINPADWHSVRGEPLVARVSIGLRAPAFDSPGCDVAGVVEQVGDSVSGFSVGDRVLGYPPEKRRGGFAEYAAISASNAALIPERLSFAEAACLPLAGGTALQALRDHARVEPGQRVMVVGASGGVGSFAVQIAKTLGADVAGVCSGRNVEFVEDLGADEVIDYVSSDYSIVADEGELFDAILQLGGTMPTSQLRKALTPDGRLIMAGGDGGGRLFGPIGRIVGGLASSAFGRGHVTMMNAEPTTTDLDYLADLVASGALRVPIEKSVTLAEVPNAIREIETAHTRGKISVVI